MVQIIHHQSTHLLPKGFYTRPAQLSDLDMVASMLNAYSRILLGVEQFRAKDMEAEWTLPDFNLEKDTCLVFAPDSSLAGYGEFWDLIAPFVRKVLWARVRPDFWGNGIGAALVAWGEGRACQQVNRAPAEARVVIQVIVSAPDSRAQKLLPQQGYRHVRSFWRMVKEFEGTPTEPAVPDGMMIRSATNNDDERRALTAAYEAFQDHWGFSPEPLEDYLERWRYFIRHDDEHDPSLWFLAEEEGEVAGVSLCRAQTSDDPHMGWVSTLGVRRPWRKRGIGLSLLQHSFCELQRRGSRRVGLGVDAQNITGATRLYEKAGMRPDRAWTSLAYEKELRPGVELSVRPDL